MKTEYNKKYFEKRDILQEHIAESLAFFLTTHRLKKILDVGCGTGQIIKYLRQRKFSAYGCDKQREAVRRAQKMNGKAIIKRASADLLPYRKNSFDVVACLSVIEHLTQQQGIDFLNESFRILKKGGYIFLITPNWNSPLRIYQGKKWFGFSDPTHIFFYSPSTLGNALKHTGYKNIQTRIAVPHTIKSRDHIPGFLQKLPQPFINILNYLMIASPLSTWRDSFWITAQKL